MFSIFISDVVRRSQFEKLRCKRKLLVSSERVLESWFIKFISTSAPSSFCESLPLTFRILVTQLKRCEHSAWKIWIKVFLIFMLLDVFWKSSTFETVKMTFKLSTGYYKLIKITESFWWQTMFALWFAIRFKP